MRNILSGLNAFWRIFVYAIFASSNILFFFVLIFFLALIKLILPIASWRHVLDVWMERLGNYWCVFMTFLGNCLSGTQWKVEMPSDLKMDGQYIVLSNHQCWVDVLGLQRTFVFKIPFLKFIIKRELIFVPFLGLIWWGMGNPMVARDRRASDANRVDAALSDLRKRAFSLLVFPEATRFTEAKRLQQKRPFENLLLPRAGAILNILKSMQDARCRWLDVTMIYLTDRPKNFFNFVSGKMPEVRVVVRDITAKLQPLYEKMHSLSDEDLKLAVREFLMELWESKQRLLDQAVV